MPVVRNAPSAAYREREFDPVLVDKVEYDTLVWVMEDGLEPCVCAASHVDDMMLQRNEKVWRLDRYKAMVQNRSQARGSIYVKLVHAAKRALIATHKTVCGPNGNGKIHANSPTGHMLRNERRRVADVAAQQPTNPNR
jgi:hypothetical protein